jgi:long-chain acyl-CoA synthetase
VNRFWLQQYPDGVPADVDVNQYSSLIELFEESFARFADRKGRDAIDAVQGAEARRVQV